MESLAETMVLAVVCLKEVPMFWLEKGLMVWLKERWLMVWPWLMVLPMMEIWKTVVDDDNEDLEDLGVDGELSSSSVYSCCEAFSKRELSLTPATHSQSQSCLDPR